MARRFPIVSLRKIPKQARSSNLVASILEAAIQVLEREGAQRFTTARVAARAGVSVGSVYQYFPNKAAILFRLQCDEWEQTTETLRGILEDQRAAPPQKLRRAVHAFIRSECEEARLRLALSDAAPMYRDAPQASTIRVSGHRALDAFVGRALPNASRSTRTMAADLIRTTLTSVGKQYSQRAKPAQSIDAFADALADMLCAYLQSLQQERPARTE